MGNMKYDAIEYSELMKLKFYHCINNDWKIIYCGQCDYTPNNKPLPIDRCIKCMDQKLIEIYDTLKEIMINVNNRLEYNSTDIGELGKYIKLEYATEIFNDIFI